MKEHCLNSPPHGNIFVMSLHIMLLSLDRESLVGQCESLASCIPSLDWPGEININCVICVFDYGHHNWCIASNHYRM